MQKYTDFIKYTKFFFSIKKNSYICNLIMNGIRASHLYRKILKMRRLEDVQIFRCSDKQTLRNLKI